MTVLDVTCPIGAVAGRQTFFCTSNVPLVSITCSFDGGAAEICSFPLEVGIGRFGTDDHTVDITVVDIFGRSLTLSFNFSLIARKSNYLQIESLITCLSIWQL